MNDEGTAVEVEAPEETCSGGRLTRLGAALGLPPLLLLRLALLLGPLALFAFALKGVRIARWSGPLSLSEGVVLCLSDLLFHAALAAGSLAGLALAARRGQAVAALAALQVFVVLYVVVTVLAQGYFLASGSVLDWGMLVFAASRPDQTAGAVGSEGSVGLWLQIIGVPVLLLLSPWLFPPLLRHLVLPAEAPPPAEPLPAPRRALTWGLPVAALLLLVLACVPRVSRVHVAFGRDPVLNILLGGVQHLAEALSSAGGSGGRPQGAVRLSQDAEGRLKNLVIILLESVRAGSVEPYNKELDITPFFEELARDSVLVDRAYAVIPHTSKALVSTLCGIEPRLSFEVIEARPGGMPGRCLADLLAEQGYDTAHFQAATKIYERRTDLVRNMGYAEFFSGDEMDHEGFEKANYFGYEDDIMLEPSRRWLAARGEAPFFVSYLTNTPHHDYRAPRRYGRKRYAKGKRLNLYLNAVHYDDHFLKNLFQVFRDTGQYEETVFLVTGDHGQGFGEHGLWIHDDIMFEEGLRVPMLVHWGGEPGRRGRIEGPVSHIDVAPTMLGALGFSVEEGGYAGRDFLRESLSGRVVRGACYRKFSCLAAIRGPHKYIHYFGNKPDQLFDLTTDPKERRSLAKAWGDQLDGWRDDLISWSRAVHEMHRPFGEKATRRWVRKEAPSPREPLFAQYGDLVELVGVDPPKRAAGRGKRFEITYYFKALAPIPAGYRLQVEGSGGTRRDRYDHVPVRGLYPFRDWQPGDYVEDPQRIRMPRSWKAAAMDLCVAIADDEGKRLPVVGNQDSERDCVHVARVPVLKKKREGGKTKRATGKTDPAPAALPREAP